MKNLTAVFFALFILTTKANALTTAPQCPTETTLTTTDLGTEKFGVFSGSKAINKLRENFKKESESFQDDIIVYEDDQIVQKQINLFSLFIRPTQFKNDDKCKPYEKSYTFEKTFDTAASDKEKCKSESEDQSQKWVQGTLSGGNPFAPAMTVEGKYLLQQCPDPCSYSSYQDYKFSDLPRTSSCQMKVKLTVLCGMPKDKTEFLATGSYLRKQVCDLK